MTDKQLLEILDRNLIRLDNIMFDPDQFRMEDTAHIANAMVNMVRTIRELRGAEEPEDETKPKKYMVEWTDYKGDLLQRSFWSKAEAVEKAGELRKRHDYVRVLPI